MEENKHEEQQQALAIVLSFFLIIAPEAAHGRMKWHMQAGHHFFTDAKKCAITSVKRIILANPMSNPLNTEPVVSTAEYWRRVLTIIENL